jgi:hypothetical protein
MDWVGNLSASYVCVLCFFHVSLNTDLCRAPVTAVFGVHFVDLRVLALFQRSCILHFFLASLYSLHCLL